MYLEKDNELARLDIAHETKIIVYFCTPTTKKREETAMETLRRTGLNIIARQIATLHGISRNYTIFRENINF